MKGGKIEVCLSQGRNKGGREERLRRLSRGKVITEIAQRPTTFMLDDMTV